MADLSARYPADRYLLPLQKRLRYRDAGGSLDVDAIKSAARLLPFVGGLDEPYRARVGKMLGRMAKAVIVIGPEGLNPGAAMDESYGFPMVLDVPEGSIRSGTSPEGIAWSSPMTGASYGFLPGTCAADREEVDVYRGPVPAAQAPLAFVVSQVGKDAERKLMVGFATAADAIRCYLANVPAECFGDLHAVPLALIGELLGYEPEAPGALAKALEVGTARAGAATLITKAGMMIAGFSRVELDGDRSVRKGVTLPGKGSPRTFAISKRGTVWAPAEMDPGKIAAGMRLSKAHDTAAACKGAITPIAAHPELADHPALTAPFSGTYDDPAAVGGWQGWIEDDAETWIAWVDVGGVAVLWTQREPDGGVIGDPVEFSRPDLARAADPAFPAPGSVMDAASRAFDRHLAEGTDPSTRKAVKLPVRILPITKGLDASTPREKRIVIGVVLEPEPFDGQGDAHDETYSAEEIERAAHAYLMSYGNLNDSHGRFIAKERAAVCQSYIAPSDLLIGGTTIKPGSWMLAAKIFDDVLWGRVLTGELGAWSIEGYAERTPNVGPPLQPTMPA